MAVWDDAILLQSPMIAASILLIIGTFRETAKLRKIAYIIIAVFGFVAFVGMCVGLLTVVYVLLFVAGLLINKKKAQK